MTETIIDLRGVHKCFDDHHVLADVSFEVKRGEVFGLLGPNGAGKTTTMRIILGLLQPTDGEARVWERDLGNEPRLRQRVGVLLENDGLYRDLSVWDNLRYYAQLYGMPSFEERAAELLEFVELSDRQRDKVGHLSAGMRRKVGLARALLHDPELLLLDEPTSSLDPEAQSRLREYLLQLSRGRALTIFLNSHNLSEVQRICDSIAVLQRGTIRAFDTVENLRTGGGTWIRLETSRGVVRERVEAVLEHSACVRQYEITTERVHVNLHNSTVAPLVRELVEAGIELEEVVRERRSLEDVYLSLVNGEALS
jgi:ABC-2 type transport system ATP-binding protein